MRAHSVIRHLPFPGIPLRQQRRRILRSVQTTDTTFRDTGIEVDSTFYYRISAVDTAFNESGFSIQASGVPVDTTAPAAPQNLTASDGPGSISLIWGPNAESDLLQYTVFRSTTQGFNPAPSDSLTRVFAPDTTFVDSSVTVNVTHYYVVSALDSLYQESAFSNEDSAKAFDPVPPAAPQNLVATAGNVQVSLVWDQNTEADMFEYIVYRSLTNGFTPTSSDSIVTTVHPDTTFTDVDVVNDQTYFYLVAAVDSFFNASDSSNQASATPAASVAYPWQTKTVMPTARTGPASGVLSGKVYIIGGTIAAARDTVNEEYDPVANTWATKAGFPSDREDFDGAVLIDKLYVVGGSSGGQNSNLTTVEAYKATTDSWETVLCQ